MPDSDVLIQRYSDWISEFERATRTVVSKRNTADFECTSLTRCPDPSTLAVPTALRTYLPQGRSCFRTPVPSRLVSNALSVTMAMLDAGQKTATKSNAQRPSLPRPIHALGEALQSVPRYSRTSFCHTQPSVLAAFGNLRGFVCTQLAAHPAFNTSPGVVTFYPDSPLPSEYVAIALITYLNTVGVAPRIPADRQGKQPLKQPSTDRKWSSLFHAHVCGVEVRGKSVDSTRISADILYLLHGESPIHYISSDYNIIAPDDITTFDVLATAYKDAVSNAPSTNELVSHNAIHDAEFFPPWHDRLASSNTSNLPPLARIVLLTIDRNERATMGWMEFVKAMHPWYGFAMYCGVNA